jgi:hypothetical protein
VGFVFQLRFIFPILNLFEKRLKRKVGKLAWRESDCREGWLCEAAHRQIIEAYQCNIFSGLQAAAVQGLERANGGNIVTTKNCSGRFRHLIDHISYAPVFLMVAFMPLIGTSLLFFVGKQYRKSQLSSS